MKNLNTYIIEKLDIDNINIQSSIKFPVKIKFKANDSYLINALNSLTGTNSIKHNCISNKNLNGTESQFTINPKSKEEFLEFVSALINAYQYNSYRDTSLAIKSVANNCFSGNIRKYLLNEITFKDLKNI